MWGIVGLPQFLLGSVLFRADASEIDVDWHLSLYSQEFESVVMLCDMAPDSFSLKKKEPLVTKP